MMEEVRAYWEEGYMFVGYYCGEVYEEECCEDEYAELEDFDWDHVESYRVDEDAHEVVVIAADEDEWD